MTFELDAELLAEAAAKIEDGTLVLADPVPRDDWKGVRATSEVNLAALNAGMPAYDEVARTAYSAASYDGAAVPLRWYAPPGHDRAGAGPAAVYVHGGGMIAGTVDLYDRWIAELAADSGVPLLAVEYRRAPEHPHPAPAEDSFAALSWLAGHAAELGVDPARIAVIGDSAGGGLAAAVALLARDRGVALARQLLVYPMLDDRTLTPDPALEPFAAWSYDNNYTGWHALLGDALEAGDVPAYAAPARAADLAGLAPLYLEVGELDIFRDEGIEYARRAAAAGVSVELHVHRGCPHGYDRAAPGSGVGRRSHADKLRNLHSF